VNYFVPVSFGILTASEPSLRAMASRPAAIDPANDPRSVFADAPIFGGPDGAAMSGDTLLAQRTGHPWIDAAIQIGLRAKDVAVRGWQLGGNLLQRAWPALSNPAVTVPGGSLAAHEAAGGHLIARHVGQTAAQLATRLAAEPHITAASSFTNLAVAESAVARTLQMNAGVIQSWLSGTSNQLVLAGKITGGVGIHLTRGASAPVNVSGVQLILRRAPDMAGGFRIQTGYPTP
jgi:hypothetical protein